MNLLRPMPPVAWAAQSAVGCSFRTADRSLSVISLVVPAGSQTPVHDHLAWGLVGLYRGEQEETVYRLEDGGQDSGRR